MKDSQCQLLIDGLSQQAPFRYVDRIISISDESVEAELTASILPDRFVATAVVDTYVMLEFAAQASGLILSKKKNQRGLVSSFNNIERVLFNEIHFPISIRSSLISARAPFYIFRFGIYVNNTLVFKGEVSIFLS